MYNEKQLKELTRDFKKDRVHTMNRILVDWGKDIYEAKGRMNIVREIMNHYLPITRELAKKTEFTRGYKISSDWLLCAIAQVVQAEATVQMFDRFNLNFTQACHPQAKGAETIELVDFSRGLSQEKGSILIRIPLSPVEGYPAGCVVISSKRKKYDVSTRNADGTYRLIAHDAVNGKHREYNLTPFQMVKMRRVE